jgi:tripeptide aminopeptidase
MTNNPSPDYFGGSFNQSFLERLLDLTIAIQQIPAPTFGEAARAALVYDRFKEEGLCDTSIDAVGNVYARLPGKGTAPPLVVTAHLDTVFPEETDLTVHRDADRIAGPGIGDNSLGVACLFGLCWALHSRPLPGDLWLVANVAEEGLGDLRGMRAVVERFGAQVKAYLVLEGMSLGQVYHRGLAVKRYEITARTAGGHSWVDFGKPSAVHELAALVQRLDSLQLHTRPRTTLNVGVFTGGTSVNTIASEARCLVDLRSEDMDALESLTIQVEKMIQAANRPGVHVGARVVGQRPAGGIPSSHILVRLGASCLEAVQVRPRLNIGSTDANLPLSRGLPAVCLGITIGGGAHTRDEFIETHPIQKGLTQLACFVEQVF